MWDKEIIKIMPSLLFLFCLLEIFEMALIIIIMNKIEKLEVQLQENLKMLEISVDSLNNRYKKK